MVHAEKARLYRLGTEGHANGKGVDGGAANDPQDNEGHDTRMALDELGGNPAQVVARHGHEGLECPKEGGHERKP
jgi:hypothetical protein